MQQKPPNYTAKIRALLANGHDAAEIAQELNLDLAEASRLIENETPNLRNPKRQRIRQLTAIMREAKEPKQLMSALRLLCKMDGSLAPAEPSLYDEVWSLISRIEDWQLPEEIKPPRAPKDEGERRRWRAQLQRLKRLLCQADDHVAAFARIRKPDDGVLVPGDGETDKIGRMSAIQLYAQECGALALKIGATNPTASPGQRAETVGKIVQTLGSNHNNAEASEWADNVLDAMGKKKGKRP